MIEAAFITFEAVGILALAFVITMLGGRNPLAVIGRGIEIVAFMLLSLLPAPKVAHKPRHLVVS